MASSYEDFMKELYECHTDGAFYLVTSEVNGLPDRSGRRDLVSMKCTYAETENDLKNWNFKSIKFYMPREDARGLGMFLVESAASEDRGPEPSQVN